MPGLVVASSRSPQMQTRLHLACWNCQKHFSFNQIKVLTIARQAKSMMLQLSRQVRVCNVQVIFVLDESKLWVNCGIVSTIAWIPPNGFNAKIKNWNTTEICKLKTLTVVSEIQWKLSLNAEKMLWCLVFVSSFGMIRLLSCLSHGSRNNFCEQKDHCRSQSKKGNYFVPGFGLRSIQGVDKSAPTSVALNKGATLKLFENCKLSNREVDYWFPYIQTSHKKRFLGPKMAMFKNIQALWCPYPSEKNCVCLLIAPLGRRQRIFHEIPLACGAKMLIWSSIHLAQTKPGFKKTKGLPFVIRKNIESFPQFATSTTENPYQGKRRTSNLPRIIELNLTSFSLENEASRSPHSYLARKDIKKLPHSMISERTKQIWICMLTRIYIISCLLKSSFRIESHVGDLENQNFVAVFLSTLRFRFDFKIRPYLFSIIFPATCQLQPHFFAY